MELKVSLNENILLQEFKGDKYLLDLENEKTYSLNEEAVSIIKCIENEPKTVSDIYIQLGGDLNIIESSSDIEFINEFVDSLKNLKLVSEH